MTIKDSSITNIMSEQVQFLTIDDEVIDAKNLMEQNNIHHLPIMENEQLAGIISSNDIAQIEYLCDFIGDKLEETKIFKSLSMREIMTKDVMALESSAKISDAMRIFSDVSFHSLPITENGKLVGIVTAKDVFRFLSLV